MDITTIYRGLHTLWVHTVDVTGTYSGVHMMWVHTVDNTAMPWTLCAVDLCRGQQRYMMWVSCSPHYIHKVIHSISPTVQE